MSELLRLLPLLACPLGMGAMMWFMMRSGRKATDAAPMRPQDRHLRNRSAPRRVGRPARAGRQPAQAEGRPVRDSGRGTRFHVMSPLDSATRWCRAG